MAATRPARHPRDEIDAVGRVAGDAADRIVTATTQGLHAAIADRVFTNLGPAAAPVRIIHDGVSTAVYAGVRAGVDGGARLAAAAARARGAEPDAITRTPRGAQLVAAANALIGHELAADDDPLTIHMGLWHDGRPLRADAQGFVDAFPDATGRVVVFVHGLGETENAWRLGNDEPYGDLMRRESGWTPLFVRYNSGLPIAENGRRLSWLLEEIAADWPVDVETMALVGHSMGGLVCRAAGQIAVAEDAAWRDRLTHVACLGTPHRGAPLEQGVHALAGLLSKLPESAPFGRILDQRSAGIRDLRRGIDAGPLLDDIHHLFVGATITADPKHPVGLVLGDLLVRSASAGGPADCEIEVDDVKLLGGINHLRLLNHARVYDLLRAFLGRQVTSPRARSLRRPDGESRSALPA